MRSSSSTKCASTCAVNSLLCRTNADNPAKSSEFPNRPNRHWSSITSLYHAKFRASHCRPDSRSLGKMASNSIASTTAPQRESSRQQHPKSNKHPSSTSPHAQNPSTTINTPTVESQGRTEQVARAPPSARSPSVPRVRAPLARPHDAARDIPVEPTLPQRRAETTHAPRRARARRVARAFRLYRWGHAVHLTLAGFSDPEVFVWNHKSRRGRGDLKEGDGFPLCGGLRVERRELAVIASQGGARCAGLYRERRECPEQLAQTRPKIADTREPRQLAAQPRLHSFRVPRRNMRTPRGTPTLGATWAPRAPPSAPAPADRASGARSTLRALTKHPTHARTTCETARRCPRPLRRVNASAAAPRNNPPPTTSPRAPRGLHGNAL